jgi:hypothetical protein
MQVKICKAKKVNRMLWFPQWMHCQIQSALSTNIMNRGTAEVSSFLGSDTVPPGQQLQTYWQVALYCSMSSSRSFEGPSDFRP